MPAYVDNPEMKEFPQQDEFSTKFYFFRISNMYIRLAKTICSKQESQMNDRELGLES